MAYMTGRCLWNGWDRYAFGRFVDSRSVSSWRPDASWFCTYRNSTVDIGLRRSTAVVLLWRRREEKSVVRCSEISNGERGTVTPVTVFVAKSAQYLHCGFPQLSKVAIFWRHRLGNIKWEIWWKIISRLIRPYWREALKCGNYLNSGWPIGNQQNRPHLYKRIFSNAFPVVLEVKQYFRVFPAKVKLPYFAIWRPQNDERSLAYDETLFGLVVGNPSEISLDQTHGSDDRRDPNGPFRCRGICASFCFLLFVCAEIFLRYGIGNLY